MLLKLVQLWFCSSVPILQRARSAMFARVVAMSAQVILGFRICSESWF